MRDYVIMADVNCDTDPAYAAAEGIAIFPQYYHFDDGVIYGDEIKLTPAEFYARLKKDRAYSMGCNPERVRGIMEEALKKGLDIYAVMASSACSGSYNTVLMESKELMELYPGSRIVVCDSFLETAPAGLLVYMAQEMKKRGASLDEVAEAVERRKGDCDVFFLVDDLKYLVRGGRLNPISGALGTMLSIKPILHIEDGKIGALTKCRGRQLGKKTILECLKKEKLEDGYLTMLHAVAEEEARAFGAELEKELGVKIRFYNDVSLIIGVHVGPNALGLAFMRKAE